MSGQPQHAPRPVPSHQLTRTSPPPLAPLQCWTGRRPAELDQKTQCFPHAVLIPPQAIQLDHSVPALSQLDYSEWALSDYSAPSLPHLDHSAPSLSQLDHPAPSLSQLDYSASALSQLDHSAPTLSQLDHSAPFLSQLICSALPLSQLNLSARPLSQLHLDWLISFRPSPADFPAPCSTLDPSLTRDPARQSFAALSAAESFSAVEVPCSGEFCRETLRRSPESAWPAVQRRSRVRRWRHRSRRCHCRRRPLSRTHHSCNSGHVVRGRLIMAEAMNDIRVSW